MFSNHDINLINRDYFEVINAGCYSITLRSKNTGHYWHILALEYNSFKSCEIYHKHNYSDNYHKHSNKGNLLKVIQHIEAHDCFQLSGRKKPTPTN